MRRNEALLVESIIAVTEAMHVCLEHHVLLRTNISEKILDNQRIASALEKVDDLKQKTEKERIRIRQLKDRQKRRNELEKIRKSNQQKDKMNTATEVRSEDVKVTQKAEVVTNQNGKVIGYVRRNKDRATFYDSRGKVVAHEFGMNTYDGKGAYVGSGRQGMRMLEGI